MKKIFRKIFITIILIIVIISLNAKVFAAGSFSISKASLTITEGKTSTFSINGSKATGRVDITSSNSSVASTNKSSIWLENNSETITVTAKKPGKATITIKGTVADGDGIESTVTKTVNITVNAKTTTNNNNGTTNSNNTTKPKQPTFTSANKTVYAAKQCNLRSSWSTSSSATSIEKGTELKLTGTSKETVNGYIWYRVQYNGATKYIASSLVTNTKPKEEEPEEKNTNNNLSSLSIKGATLSPEFNKDTLQYTVQIEENITKLDIEAKAENSKAKVEIQGNEELLNGENTIKVIVTAEDNTSKTYVIKAIRGNKVATTLDDTLKLSKLEILGVSFDGGFDPEKYTYDLSLNLAVSNLTITAEPNQEDAKVEIIGNQDFKEGENLITIMLTSADKSQTATYQIKVNLPAIATENKNDLQLYLICAAVALVVIAFVIIGIVIYHRRKKNEEKEEYQEENEEQQKGLKQDKELAEVTSKKKALDEFLDNSKLEEKPKKTRGRHSV